MLEILTSKGERLVAALLAALLAILFFGSRWISYIGYSPVFVCDIFFVTIILVWLFSRTTRTTSNKRLENTPVYFAVWFFALWVMARMLFSLSSRFNLLDELRDFMPFAYSLLALMTASLFPRLDERWRQDVFKFLVAALYGHLIWCLVVLLTGNLYGFEMNLIISGSPIFGFRPDIDTALVVVLLMILFRSVVTNGLNFFRAAAFCACFYVISFSPARASLISLFACAVWFVFNRGNTATDGNSNLPRRRNIFGLVTFSLIPIALVFLSSGGERLLATLGLGSQDSLLAASAEGTRNARQLVWTQVIDWTNADILRVIFGSGFGINFLEVTQSLAYLEGTTYTGVRSPHNFLITVVVRLGWPAAIIFALIVLGTLKRNWNHQSSDDFTFLAMVVVLALLPVSLLGVILEAPFGAIPFYICLGILLSRNKEHNPHFSRRKSS